MSKATDKETASFTRRVAKLWAVFSQGEQDRQTILDGLTRLAEGKKVEAAEPETYFVTPDATRTFEQRKVATNQTYWNSNITEVNFAMDPVEGEVELLLHHFNEAISDAEATRRLDEEELVREDRLPVILALLERYPDLQRHFVIITGAAWVGPDGSRSVVFAYGDSQGLDLSLGWDDFDWLASCRFLVRRK